LKIQDLYNLKGKIAIVTGASGLIGKYHCEALAEAGATVIACDLNTSSISNFIHNLGNNSYAINLDVTDKSMIESVRNFIIENYASIDILVNNAAINDMFENPQAASEQSKFENYPLELWKKSLEVNITGVFLCSQVFGKVMADKGKGSIINVASTYGIVGPDQSLYIDESNNQNFFKPPAYSTTKGAVIAFTKFLAAYWGKKGVRVNTLSPGGVENSQDKFFIKKYSQKTPLNRMASSEDYKGSVVFLASDASSYMTGANLVVDGGWTCW